MKFKIFIALALSAAMLSGCGNEVTQNSDGSVTLKGSALCTAADGKVEYTVFLSVTADKEGRVIEITDDGTVVPDGKDDKYKASQELFEQLKGKTIDSVDDVDAVSGATASGDAVKEAVKNALEQLEKD
ncbi:MAG: FMN-binding protein [Ruminococcus sp.]|nr:FMN-binding protein [Ruminococcus sp.]